MSNTINDSLSGTSELSHQPMELKNSAQKETGELAANGGREAPYFSLEILKEWVKKRFDKPAAPGLVFAGFWHRLLAFFIDFPVSLALSLSIIMVLELAVPAQIPYLNTVGGNTAAMLALQFLYFVAFESSNWKATPGKRLLKLRVTDSRGRRLNPLRAAARTALKILDPFTFGAAILWMFFSKKHQTLYDKFCETLVLRKTDQSFLPAQLRRWHWPIVVCLAMAMSLVTFRTAVQIAIPRVDSITLKLAIGESLNDIESAQKAVEQAVKKDGKMPARLDVSLFPVSKSISYRYRPADGALSILFDSGKLKGAALILSPKKDGSSTDLVWSCAAVNIPATLAPSRCAATTESGRF